MSRKVLLITLFFFGYSLCSGAQPGNAGDSILLGGIVVDRDTFPMVFLGDVDFLGRLPRKLARKHQANNRLRYNVYKTYPYAVIAAGVLKDVDANLALISDKKAQKAYMKAVEKELKAKFKGELEDMTISQGQVLVKLINRQTGKDCYSILKEVKGGFNAVIYQSLALLFSNNLKREYDAAGRDRDMELIVQELEARNRHRYEYYRQQQQLQTRRN
jgi:hypothetical protein